MRITAGKIFEYILTSFDSPQAKLDELISNALVTICESIPSQIEISELTEKHRPTVIKKIGLYMKQCEEESITPDVSFGITNQIIKNNRYQLKTAKNAFLEWIGSIDPYKFEKLCKLILELEGCKNVFVTPPSGDGGIDFYGTKEIAGTSVDNPDIFKNIKILVLGQAKRYKDKIGIAHLREFIGSSSLVKFSCTGDIPACLPKYVQDVSYRPLSPLMLILIATNGANSDTEEVAKWLGIRILSNDQILEILYRNQIGFRTHSAGVIFEPKDFDVL